MIDRKSARSHAEDVQRLLTGDPETDTRVIQAGLLAASQRMLSSDWLCVFCGSTYASQEVENRELLCQDCGHKLRGTV